MTILDKFYAGDTLALAKVISHIENYGPQTDEILADIYPKTGKGLSIGITGPPGAGKSTLVDRLCALFSKRGRSQFSIYRRGAAGRQDQDAEPDFDERRFHSQHGYQRLDRWPGFCHIGNYQGAGRLWERCNIGGNRWRGAGGA